MTENTTTEGETSGVEASKAWLHILAGAVLVSAFAVATLGFGVTPGVAANNTTTAANLSDVAPYYANQSTAVNNASWMANHSDPTLQNATFHLVRFVSFVIGTGDPAPGGVGLTGPLMLTLTLMGAFLGTLVNTRTGMVGGGVLAVMAIAAFSTVGMAPSWLYVVLLFVLGLILSAVARRAMS